MSSNSFSIDGPPAPVPKPTPRNEDIFDYLLKLHELITALSELEKATGNRIIGLTRRVGEIREELDALRIRFTEMIDQSRGEDMRE